MKTKSTVLSVFSRQLLLCLGFCLLVASAAFGQAIDAKKFASVPVSIRDRLIERLNLFLEYKRTDQEEKLYDLISEYYKTVSWKTKADYIKSLQDQKVKGAKKTFVAFDVSSAEDHSLDDSDYRIFHIKGVVRFKRDGKIKKEHLLLDARYENGDWYFSDWLKEEIIID